MTTTESLRAFTLEHLTRREATVVQRLTALRTRTWLTALFMIASRLGDGPLWYGWGAGCLLLGDRRARIAVAAGALAVSVSVALFVLIKKRINRPRPYEIWADLPCLVIPPDRFSFPSGHTMTAFAVFGVFHQLVPETASILLPTAALIGLSRVFLGVHYPSDVLVGSLLGGLVGAGIGRFTLSIIA